MGCQASKRPKDDQQSQFNDKAFRYGTKTELLNMEVVSIDPDLGWRQISNASNHLDMMNRIPVPVSVFRDPHEWHNKYGESEKETTESSSLYPLGWTIVFYNERSGEHCKTCLVTLSLNIAIRAKDLARVFGVVHEAVVPDDDSTYKRISLVSSRTEVLPRRIYEVLGIPDFDWVLLSRQINLKSQRGFKEPLVNCLTQFKKKSLRSLPRYVDVGSETTPILQMFENHSDSSTPRRVLADVASLGMNVAEQLHRLERKRDNRHPFPTAMFGWTILAFGPGHEADYYVTARTPDEKVVQFVPEELIMNITQWVQKTYMTSALL